MVFSRGSISPVSVGRVLPLHVTRAQRRRPYPSTSTNLQRGAGVSERGTQAKDILGECALKQTVVLCTASIDIRTASPGQNATYVLAKLS